MNFILSVTSPEYADTLMGICDKLQLSSSVILFGRGTATKSMLELLGIESRARRVVVTVADRQSTRLFIKEQRRQMYIDTPGRGIVVCVPVKSVGGAKALEYLGGGKETAGPPELNYEYELILAIANEGHADDVMDAARTAGATGGTILHGKGTGSKNAEKFYRLSIAKEKEVLIIVSKADAKADIMRAILQGAGPDSAAGAIVFSLPVSEIAGFRLTDDEGDAEG